MKAQWVQTELKREFPNIISQRGAVIKGRKRVFRDFDGNGTVGNLGDFIKFYKLNRPVIVRAGADNGNVTRMNAPTWEVPSIIAASSRSRGIVS